jgi:hypothetical protein
MMRAPLRRVILAPEKRLTAARCCAQAPTSLGHRSDVPAELAVQSRMQPLPVASQRANGSSLIQQSGR